MNNLVGFFKFATLGTASILVIGCLFSLCSAQQKPEERLYPASVEEYKCGYIDAQGKMVIEPEFGVCSAFSEGLAFVVKPSIWWRFQDSLDVSHSATERGFIDQHGKYAFKVRSGSWASAFSDGLARLISSRHLGDYMNYGFVDPTGKIVIPQKFEQALDFSEGLAAVAEKVHGPWGYINKTGAYKIVPRFEEAHSFHEGRATVKVSGRWGYIDAAGEMVVPAQFARAEDFSEGLASVINTAWRTGYIDRDGHVVIDFQFSNGGPFAEGLAVATGYSSNGKSMVMAAKDGYIDRSGKYVIQPAFTDAYSFSDGVARVSVESLHAGFVDHGGKFITPPQWAGAEDFHNGLAKVYTGLKRPGAHDEYIDKAGNIVWPK